MDDFSFVNVAEDVFNVLAGAAGDAAGVAAAVVDQAASDFDALRREAGNGGATLEFANNVHHADRQQALADAQGLDGAGIQNQFSVELQMVGEPLFCLLYPSRCV